MPGAVSCAQKPPTALNGRWPDSCLDAAPGATCKAMCNANSVWWYNRTGTPTVTCQADGQWSPSSAICAQMVVKTLVNPVDNDAVVRAGCMVAGAFCEKNEDCCNGFEKTGPFTYNVLINDCISGICTPPACFSGDTKVVVQGLKAPVAIRDLQTGHFVQCLDSGADLTQPSTVRWCEVANWLHAEAKQLLQTRIRFNRMGGSPGSITVSPTHMVLRLTSDAAAAPAGATAASVAAFGAFATVPASSIVAGDRLVLLADPQNAAAGFFVAAVTAVESITAEGMYVPAIESPYIVADGVVMPLLINLDIDIIAPAGVSGPKAAALQYAVATAFMQRMQPIGTPGTNGRWTDGAAMWPGLFRLLSIMGQRASVGRVENFTAAREWFVPRYAACKANPSAAVSLEEAAAFFGDGAWVTPTGI